MNCLNLKQFVDQKTCLECKGCCRFKEEESMWRPNLTDSECQKFLKEKNNQSVVDGDQCVKSVFLDGQHICSLLESKTGLCQVYQDRPFECVLYPFVLVKKEKSIFVAAHLACPFIQDKKESDDFLKYCNDLKSFFSKAENKQDIEALAQTYSLESEELENLFLIFETI